jgi:hypothetical protein
MPIFPYFADHLWCNLPLRGVQKMLCGLGILDLKNSTSLRVLGRRYYLIDVAWHLREITFFQTTLRPSGSSI